MSQPWDDYRIEDEIEREWKAHGETYQYMWVRQLCRRICHDQEARIAELEALAPSDEVRNAIGYCWRWAQGYAEKGGADSDERYAFMCSQIDIVLAWWNAIGGWAHKENGATE